jgi:DNA-binding CsgD family transcriptional regulator
MDYRSEVGAAILDLKLGMPGPCFLCSKTCEPGAICSTCRPKLNNLSVIVTRHLMDLVTALMPAWDHIDVQRQFAPWFVEPARTLAFVRNVEALDTAVTVRAPQVIIEKIVTNLRSILNPRTFDEVLLLMPDREWQMILKSAGVYEALAQKLPFVRHFRAMFEGPTEVHPHSKEAALDVIELARAWGLGETNGHWREKLRRHLRLSERKALRRTLLAGEQPEQVKDDFLHHLDAAVHLAMEVPELKPDEPIEDYIRRLLRHQASSTREVISLTDREQIISGDATAWETIPARPESGDVAPALSELASQFRLTAQAREIWKLKYEGYSEMEIAARCGVSQPWVSQTLMGIRRKLGSRVS